jgi:hypothetical protein
MIYNKFALVRYDADEGKVFDWKEPRYDEVLIDENNPELGTRQGEQQHLYVNTLFIGGNDSIENYVEVDEEGNATELTTPTDMASEKERAYDILMGVSE